MTTRPWSIARLGALALLLAGCGERSGDWDTQFRSGGSVGLATSVAVVDQSLQRVVFLSAPRELELRAHYVPVGRDVTRVEASKDGTQLFLLSRGVSPRRHPDDEKPRFTVIETSGSEPHVVRDDQLAQALSGLVIDDEGEWAVIYDAGASSGAYVTNPNELILVDLTTAGDPMAVSLDSKGGRPQRLSFTRPLLMPDGSERRFLLVQREHDVALVDLLDLDHHVTVGSPENEAGREAAPAEVAYYPGDEANNAQFAVRFSDDTSVGVLELHAPESGEEDRTFSVSYNLVDVGGAASSIEYVHTDGGVRLAAVVPGTSSAQLIDTVTSNVTEVDFDYAFSGIKLVTDDIANRPESGDVALLFSDRATAVGFWALGKTADQAYRSLDTQEIGVSVAQVFDVPGTAYSGYKILKSAQGTSFFVLDLDGRRSFPMLALSSAEISVALDGQRVWAYQAAGTELARVTFDDLHPVSLSTERNISGVFDIAREDGGRAVIALHEMTGLGIGATVFDALDPDTAHSRFYSGFELAGVK
jgi:hypothetical protein